MFRKFNRFINATSSRHKKQENIYSPYAQSILKEFYISSCVRLNPPRDVTKVQSLVATYDSILARILDSEDDITTEGVVKRDDVFDQLVHL